MHLQAHVFIQSLVLCRIPKGLVLGPVPQAGTSLQQTMSPVPQGQALASSPGMALNTSHRVLTDGILVPACGDRYPTEPFLCHPRIVAQLSGTLIFLNDVFGQIILTGKVNVAANNECPVLRAPAQGAGRVA